MSLALTLPRKAWSPGEALTGAMTWALPAAPDVLELRLYWYTRGKGSTDLTVVQLERWIEPGAEGTQRFELPLPPAPHSFSGPLLSVAWALEAVAEPDGQAARVELVVGPDRKERRVAASGLRARDNPFASHRIDRLRYQLTDIERASLLERFDQAGRIGQLVGPPGSGKTALRRELEEALGARGFSVRRLAVRPGEWPDRARLRSFLAGALPGALLSVDGADGLGPVAWRRILRAARSAGGLLVTARRSMRLPTLYTHATSPALLRDLVEVLIGSEEADRMQERCKALFARHDGDLGACLHALYDDFAARPAGLPAEPTGPPPTESRLPEPAGRR